jgi:phosphopantetheinyl transferase
VENEISFLEKEGFCPKEFFKIWTGKEAIIKKHGKTMSDIKKIDVTKENLIVLEENGYIISINI